MSARLDATRSCPEIRGYLRLRSGFEMIWHQMPVDRFCFQPDVCPVARQPKTAIVASSIFEVYIDHWPFRWIIQKSDRAK